MFSREKILYWIVLGFAVGLAIEEIVANRQIFLWFFIAATICAAAVFLLMRKNPSLATSTAPGALVLTILILSCSLLAGFLRSGIQSHVADQPTKLDQFVGQKIVLRGVLTEEQERRDFNTRLTLRVREVGEANPSESAGKSAGELGVTTDINQKILVTTGNPKEFHYGDVVEIRGQLIRPENFYTDTGREFDYVGYLASSGTKFLIRNASVKVLGHDPPSRIIESLFLVKRAFVRSLGAALPEPQSSLASGILIDGKQSINGELQEKFQKTGLIHIVVLSGSNVSIIAEAIGKAFAFLPRTAGLISSSIGIILFTIITGASATIVRASIMAILVLLSRFSLRNYDPARGLFIASFLMLIHNPMILLHSPSFQLSFLATFTVVRVIPSLESSTAGIGFLGTVFTRVVQFLPERFGFRELVTSNIVVQTFLFPVLTWMTGFFSAVSLPVNLLVLPFIPLTMLAAFLTAVAGLVSSGIGWILGAIFHVSVYVPFALPFAFLSQTLLSYELMIVNFFAKFSLAEIPFNLFSSSVVVGFYCVVIFWFLFCVRGEGSSAKEERK